LPVSLVYSSRRHLAPRTSLVLEFVLEQVRQAQAMTAAAEQETQGSTLAGDEVRMVTEL
jgi:hypothetical protein